MPTDKLINKYKSFIGPNKLLTHLFSSSKRPTRSTSSDSSSDVESYTYQHTPPYITGTLRTYQIEGLNWLIQMHALNINCVLADEMGLGKTLQTISFLGHLKEYCRNKRPHLLIVPKSTLHNWKNEFARFYPSYRIYTFHCSKTDFSVVKNEIRRSKHDVIVTTYEMCITNKILQQFRYGYVIIDEAHRIKNENSKLSQFVRVFRCRHRLLITGTPLQNNVRELWALLNFLVPKLFSDGDVFESWIVKNENKKINDKSKTNEISDDTNNSDKSENESDDVKSDNESNDESSDSNEEQNENVSFNDKIVDDKEVDDKSSDSNEEQNINSKNNTNEKQNIKGKNNMISDNNFDSDSENNDSENNDSESVIVTKRRKCNETTKFNKEHSKKNIMTSEPEDNIQQLRKVILPFFLRREKADVEASLQPKKIINLYPSLSEMQRLWYRTILKKEITSENVLTNKSALMNIVMQLRKVCNHPYLFDGAEPEPYTTDEHLITNSGKMVYLDKLLRKYKEEGCKVLIFSQMSRMLDILEDYCMHREYEYRRLDGSTSLEDRQKGIEEFHSDPNIFIYLLTTRAGGLGINLTAAEVVIIFDSDWNPQMDLQAMDRAHRIGQKKQVKVFRLISENTIEEKIIIRCMQKLKLDERLLKNKKSDRLNKDELMNIITTGVEDLQGDRKEKDASIEEILKTGEARTGTLNEKINGKTDQEPEFDYYKWEGEDYKKRVHKLTQFIGFNEKYMGRSRVRHKKQINIYDFQFHSQELRKLMYKELERELTYEELARKNRLMKDVFNWSFREFELYLKACENVGKNIEDILDYLFKDGHAGKDSNNVNADNYNANDNNHDNANTTNNSNNDNSNTDKDSLKNFTAEEVRRFHAVFWERTHEVSDIEKSLYIIEKTEAKRLKTINIHNILQRRFDRLKEDIEAYKRGELLTGETFSKPTKAVAGESHINNGCVNNAIGSYLSIYNNNDIHANKSIDAGDIYANKSNVDTNTIRNNEDNNNIKDETWLEDNKDILLDIFNDEAAVMHLCRNIKVSYSQNTRSKYFNDKIDKLILLLQFIFYSNDSFEEIARNVQCVKWLRFDYFMRTRDEKDIGKRLRTLGDLLLKNEAHETKNEDIRQTIK